MRRFTVTLFALLFIKPLPAGELLLKSGPAQVGLLELYTSEGCSSCPPADRYLRTLVGRPGLFSAFVPLAFHVDYWDYIGWKDRFATAAFSERQRQYARQGGVRSVYTPGFIYNGREWRNFFGGEVHDFPGGLETGELVLRVGENAVEVTFQPTVERRIRYVANVALLGFGLRTEVEAGENRGRELRHDFVVLAHVQSRLAAQGAGHSGRMALPESGIPADRYALVAWISAGGNLAPLQAVGAYLPTGN